MDIWINRDTETEPDRKEETGIGVRNRKETEKAVRDRDREAQSKQRDRHLVQPWGVQPSGDMPNASVRIVCVPGPTQHSQLQKTVRLAAEQRDRFLGRKETLFLAATIAIVMTMITMVTR